MTRGIFTFVLLSNLVACGDEGGVARPRPISESATSDPGDIEPQIGVCRKLCCSASDCGGSTSCTPFVEASGTLGVCVSGSDTATSVDPPAGATLPASCWSNGAADCNALTSEGCAAGDACDFAAGEPDVEPVVSCFGGDNVQAEAESCDNALGPWCQPGWHCVGE